MLNFLKNWMDDNGKAVKALQKTVDQINELEDSAAGLSDEQLQAKTDEFRNRLVQGETLDDLLPEAFAVCREASKRVLKMRHFDVQLMGGIVLHQGNIAEMRTGEGKTLVATLPVYLNALTGKGVHLVSVNDSLARRDSEWMGKLYRFLGLSVGLSVHGMTPEEKREAYNCDITYGTNNEFGFDYLRDNMAHSKDSMVQRELNYAIVDEVDSILIDEARTPLIISGQAEKPTEMYYTMAKTVARLKNEADYTIDEKAKTVVLTEEGVSRAESMLSVENLYDDVNRDLLHYLMAALKAKTLFKRDRDYVVKDGQVIIVDEFTGRLMFGRRYSDGLHQAIEAKENVKIERESQTLATITFQNYFRMYDKLAGMTGTAETEMEEFDKIYHLDVIVIPTNRKMIRVDYPDVVYKTEQAKFRAVINEITECHAQGQPVLVGTVSIEKSEILSHMLQRQGIAHQVLNAKFHEKEAEIISQAGRKGAVTIATNMAGRGTDILLGGNPEMIAQMELRKQGKEEDQELHDKLLRQYQHLLKQEKQDVIDAGGLHIIGTERHESRRIDNQLRGRAGRQGDPGSTRFYISLEDDLMRLFGSDNLSGVMDRLGLDEDMPIENKMVTKSIESAQKRVESRNFSARKHVLEYDDVMNQQREVIYAQRRQVLMEDDLKQLIRDMIGQVIDDSLDTYCSKSIHELEWDLNGLLEYARDTYLPATEKTAEDLEGIGRDSLKEMFLQEALARYEEREEKEGAEMMRRLEKVILLRTVDSKWMDHLDAMDQLRDGIGLRAYGQRDPLVEYKFEGYDMFQNMIASLREEVVRMIFRARLVVQAPQGPSNMHENRGGDEEPAKKTVRKGKTVGRNDPCPCGSGKKYKKCCGR